jgi:iduronate 2-sulfatase
VRTAAGRYTEWRDWKTGKVLGQEWYDHARDPNELDNQAGALESSPAGQAARTALRRQFPPSTAPVNR